MGGFVPHAEKWVFISRRLEYRVGGENIRKINSFRIIGQGKFKVLCPINSVKLLIFNKL